MAFARRIDTDLAIIDVTNDELLVREIIEGCGFEDLEAKTGAPLSLADDCKPLTAPDIDEN